MKKISLFKVALKSLLAVSFLFLSACAFGPLMSHETGRTVGEDNHELVGAYGPAGYLFKWNYGVSEDFDFGVHIEALSVGLRGKYAFFQNETHGWSMAGAFGIGTSVGGSHQYADLIASYLFTSWEPYGTIRAVHVSVDPVSSNDQNSWIHFKSDRREYDYGQVFLGSRYWWNKNWNWSVEVSQLFGFPGDLKLDKTILGSASIGYRF